MICIKRNPSKRNSLVIPVKIIRDYSFNLWILHLLVKLNPVVHVRQNDPAQDLFKLPPFIQITVITGHDFSQSLYFGYFFIPLIYKSRRDFISAETNRRIIIPSRTGLDGFVIPIVLPICCAYGAYNNFGTLLTPICCACGAYNNSGILLTPIFGAYGA